MSHAQRILSPDFLACDVRGLHIKTVIQHQEICIGQERKEAAVREMEQLKLAGKSWAQWGRASPHPRNGQQYSSVVPSLLWQLCSMLG